MHDLNPSRLFAELRELRERFPTLRLLPLEYGTTTLEGPILIDGETRWIRLGLPPGYPAVPPELREIDGPRGAVVPAQGRTHRFPDGTLCLFPHGNHEQTWRHDRLAVDAVEQFVALVRMERTTPITRKRVFHGRDRLIVPSGAGQLLRVPQGRGTLIVRRPGPARGDMFVDIIREEKIEHHLEATLSEGWRGLLPHAEEVFLVAYGTTRGLAC